MTVEELAEELDERGLTLVIHDAPVSPGDRWMIWLYPSGEPELLIQRSNLDLERAIVEALREWDR